MNEELAILGGEPSVTIPHPHKKWPPDASLAELEELSQQRNLDISIKGRRGPIFSFEEAFLHFLKNEVKYAITFNSGTSALLAAYFALGIEEGDEVIGPCLTYHAALSPLFLLRATPVLVDIDINSRCIDPRKIESAITPKTKAITVVHQWGHPADMDSIMTIAKKHALYVIEDCSHAHGSKYKGQMCGTFGNVAVYSLQANKAVFAGEGGILVTNSAVINDRATLLGHYRDRSKENVVDPAMQKYHVTGFGQKLRMSPFNAVVAKHALLNFPAIKEERHQCLHYFNKRLSQVSYIDPLMLENDIDMGAWYGFKPLYIPERNLEISRDLLILALKKEGVEISKPSGPLLSTLPLYSIDESPLFPSLTEGKREQQTNYPVGKFVDQHALSLPTFYSWKHHKPIIDQYIDAFIKVGNNAERLKNVM